MPPPSTTWPQSWAELDRAYIIVALLKIIIVSESKPLAMYANKHSGSSIVMAIIIHNINTLQLCQGRVITGVLVAWCSLIRAKSKLFVECGNT